MFTRIAPFAVLSAVFLLGAPVSARADDVPSARELALQRQIDELKKDNELLRQLVASLRETSDVKQKLAALEQKVDAMARPKVQTRIAGALPETGTIRLENRLNRVSTVVVDNLAYRLQPGEARELRSQPAGPFTYEVLVDGIGSLGRATRNLNADSVFTIYAYIPQPVVVIP